MAVAAAMGTGVAEAGSPTVVGQTYSAAQTALSSAGYAVVVSTTVGDQLSWPNCIVTHQQDRTKPPEANSSASPVNQTLLSLNCEAAVASATSPGNSLGSPEGRAAAAAAASSSAAAAASASAAPAT
ncbi:hypothetical protein [Mycolicibacterium sphagni]|uniref:hypothetical protein n=1 Tax=Mycolicibacterium sphagni TaxID=1786 RepID=UPI001F16ABE6|nr:hypothetical protein [Mycolicibacterium sphagni]